MIFRLVLLGAIFMVGTLFIAVVSEAEVVPTRTSLVLFPVEIDGWRGADYDPFEPRILAELGVDEYIHRAYRKDGHLVGLYLGFYESQRQGDTIHSPLNCLPGAGWQPLEHSYLPIDVGPQTITVNRYSIQKGLTKQVVLYWYQSHGRVVANEYKSKVYMVYDAIRLNRSDAALVRVISPVRPSDGESLEPASDRAVEFVQAMFPLLSDYLPD